MSKASTSVAPFAKAAVVALVAASVAFAGVGTATAFGAQSDATTDVATEGITSEVAASSSASANASVRTASSTSVTPGQTVAVTLTLTGNGGTPNIEESFSPNVESSTITGVTVDGKSASPFLNTSDNTGALVTFASSVSSGATIKVTYQVKIPSSASPGQNFTLSGKLTNTQESSVDDTVLTVEQNDPPNADAGPDLTAEGGNGPDTFLTATGSTDPDGDSLDYNWTQTAGPSVSLSNASAGVPSFAPPSVSSTTTLTFEVTVSDGSGGTDTDTVNVTVEPAGSSAGPARSVPSSISPGGTKTVTITANVSDSGFSITEAFSPSVDSASIKKVKVNDNTVSPFLANADPNGLVVTLQSSSVSAGDRVKVKYQVSVSGSAAIGDVYSISGNVTSGQTTTLGTDRITVQKSQKPEDKYDKDGDGVEVTELGEAASAYVKGKLDIKDLGAIAAAYVGGGS